ncbi:Uncharacterized protein TCM_010320, partial [Theobroma cacao]
IVDRKWQSTKVEGRPSFRIKVWCLVLRWWDLVWVMPHTVEGIIRSWDGHRVDGGMKSQWTAVCGSTFWSLWLACNQTIFNGKKLGWGRTYLPHKNELYVVDYGQSRW